MSENFLTPRYRENADRTFGRMGLTTLRRTGLEKVLGEATRRNMALLEQKLAPSELSPLRESSPEAVWGAVKKSGLAKQGVPIVGMSLGNPSAYEEFPPNSRLYESLAAICADPTLVRQSSGYTSSFGYPPLLDQLRRVNLADPRSIGKERSRFGDVRVYTTSGGSDAAELVMGPLLLTPADTLMVSDWTYIIHLGSAYFRNAHVDSYELREDGRPDTRSLEEALSSERRNRRPVQAVVFTTIGNPVGAAMSRDDIAEHLRVISASGEKAGRPIMAIADVAYEAFRRDGAPLDPIEIAIDEKIPVPVAVIDTASKGYGLCGWRLGKLAIYWPEGHFDQFRADYFTALENKMLPQLGAPSVPLQMAFSRFFEGLERDAGLMEETMGYFRMRRSLVNGKLASLASAMLEMDGVYLASYYDHGGRNGGLEPGALSSFYLLFGFTKLNNLKGSGFNQAVAFGEFCLGNGAAVVNCVPGRSFLPQKRWANHPALIRVTGLTTQEDTALFLDSVRAFAEHLG
ncbi:MAG: pyridoxal phosphate-dependent aminotransferase [Candidatus Micrarchaeota archaeon]